MEGTHSGARASVRYVAVNSLNTLIVTLNILDSRTGKIRISIWNVKANKVAQKFDRDIPAELYPVPRFSPCGQFLGIPLRPCKPSQTSVVELINCTGEKPTVIETVTISVTLISIALTHNCKRLAVSENQQVSAPGSARIHTEPRTALHIDHVYGRNVNYMDGERYVLAIVDSMGSHVIVKWEISSGAVVQYLNFGQSKYLSPMLEMSPLSPHLVVIRHSENSSQPRLPVRVYSLENPEEGATVGKAEEGARDREIPVTEWDFVASEVSKDGLIFVRNGILCHLKWDSMLVKQQARIDRSAGKGTDVLALVHSELENQLTLVFEDGHIGVGKLREPSPLSSRRTLGHLVNGIRNLTGS